MLRKTTAALFLASAMLLVPTTAAFADESDYVPEEPPGEPTLAGSSVTGVCDGDVPYIVFDVELTDPDSQATGNTAVLTMTDGSNSHSITLGDLVDGKLSGSVLWPGASINPPGWPGWMQIDGQWVQTDGNFGWTRSVTGATIELNPDLSVALSYPPSSPDCNTAPPGGASHESEVTASSGGIAETGVSESMLLVALAAAGLIVVGGVVMLARRRVKN